MTSAMLWYVQQTKIVPVGLSSRNDCWIHLSVNRRAILPKLVPPLVDHIPIAAALLAFHSDHCRKGCRAGPQNRIEAIEGAFPQQREHVPAIAQEQPIRRSRSSPIYRLFSPRRHGDTENPFQYETTSSV